MKKFEGRTRRLAFGLAVGAPLLFGGSYLAASALSPHELPEVIEVPMVMEIPVVAGVGCIDEDVTTAEMAAFLPGEAEGDEIDSAATSCSSTLSHELFIAPLEEVGELSA